MTERDRLVYDMNDLYRCIETLEATAASSRSFIQHMDAYVVAMHATPADPERLQAAIDAMIAFSGAKSGEPSTAHY